MSGTDFLKAARMADRLEEMRALMKRIHGDQWPEKSAPYREALRQAMQEQNTQNVLSAVVPLAQDVARKGHSPVMLLAVAADMAAEEKAVAS